VLQRAKLPLLFLLLTSATLLHAGLVTYSDQPIFDAQGIIAYNTSFTCRAGFCLPGDPWTIGGVTYTSGSNLIIGPDVGYGNSVPLLTYDYWSPVPATIETSPGFNMLGFRLGTLGASSLMNITVDTNLTSYSFVNETVPNSDAGLQFFGFVATGGEYLTGFTIASVNGRGSGPGITNVELGNAGNTAPEPSSVLLLASSGLGLVGLLRRRLRQ